MNESEDLIYWDEDGNAFSVPRNESAHPSKPDVKRSHTLNPCPSSIMDESDDCEGRNLQYQKNLNSSVTKAFVKYTQPTSKNLSQESTPRSSKTTLSKESQATVAFTHTQMVPRDTTHSTAARNQSDDLIFQHCPDSDSGASTQFMEMEEQLTGVVMECSKGGGNSSGSTSTSVSLHSASIPTLSTMPHLLHATPLPAPALPVVSTVAGCKRKADASQLQQAPSLETLTRAPITNTCSADKNMTATSSTNITNTTAATITAITIAPSPVTPIITTTPALHTSTNATAHPTTANITIQITTPSTLITPTQPTSTNTTSTNTMHNTEMERQRAADLAHLERVLGNPQVCARLQPVQLAALRDRLVQLLFVNISFLEQLLQQPLRYAVEVLDMGVVVIKVGREPHKDWAFFWRLAKFTFID